MIIFVKFELERDERYQIPEGDRWHRWSTACDGVRWRWIRRGPNGGKRREKMAKESHSTTSMARKISLWLSNEMPLPSEIGVSVLASGTGPSDSKEEPPPSSSSLSLLLSQFSNLIQSNNKLLTTHTNFYLSSQSLQPGLFSNLIFFLENTSHSYNLVFEIRKYLLKNRTNYTFDFLSSSFIQFIL